MFCPKCTAIVPDGSKFCNKCSAPLTIEDLPQEKPKVLTTCPKCGIYMEPDSKICTDCGHILSIKTSPKSKKLALVCLASVFLLVVGGYLYTINKNGLMNKADGLPVSVSIANEAIDSSLSTRVEEPFESDTGIIDSPSPSSDVFGDYESDDYDPPEYDMENLNGIMESAIDDVPGALLTYYLNYLKAINTQNESYLTNATPEQTARLKERIFGVNKDDLFSLDQIIIDLDTFDVYESGNQLNASFYAAFAYGYKSRKVNGKLDHGANVQLVTMIFDVDTWEWIVSNGEITQDITPGPNRLVLSL